MKNKFNLELLNRFIKMYLIDYNKSYPITILEESESIYIVIEAEFYVCNFYFYFKNEILACDYSIESMDTTSYCITYKHRFKKDYIKNFISVSKDLIENLHTIKKNIKGV